MVPGPALKDEAALVKPPLPEGPLPEVEWNKIGQKSQQQPQAQGQTASDQQQPTIQQQPAPAPAPAPVAPPPTNIPAPGERAISGPRD